MQLSRALLAAFVIGAVAGVAHAQSEGNLMMRIRAVNIDPADKSDAIGALAVPGDAIQVSNKTIPEIDFTYFFSKQLAAELILTYPQKHTVRVTQSAAGAFDAGTFKHLPPTLTLQYHFLPDQVFRPYVGAGVNVTRISAVHLDKLNQITGGNATLSKTSVGAALQAGFDVKVGANVYLNVDVKKVWLDTDLSLNGTKLSTVKVDPILLGIGVGFRF